MLEINQELVAVFGKLRTQEECRKAQALLNKRLSEIGHDAMKHAVEQGIVPGAPVEVKTDRGWKPGVVEGVHTQTATIKVEGVQQKRFFPSEIRLLKN